MQPTQKWNMKVDTRIVRLLSRRTYENFPGAIRELVSNAYDAGAKRVDIEVDQEGGRISVADDGCGMSVADFERYLTIAAKTVDRSESTELNRRRIGQFGIGFLAAIPFCQTLLLETKVRNDDSIVEAQLPAHSYMEAELTQKSTDLTEIPIPGRVVKVPSRRAESGTKVTLVKLTDLAGAYFRPQPDARADSVRRLPGEARLKWELQQCLPIEYRPDSAAGKLLTYEPPPVPMDVYLNGTRLYRNLPDGELLEHATKSLAEGKVRVKYAILYSSNRKPVRPLETRGLQLRVCNVGIGLPDYFGIGKVGRTYGYLYWVYGEAQILEGLDDALSVTRDSFVWTSEYEELLNFLGKRLHERAMGLERMERFKKELERETKGKRRYAVRRREGLVARREILTHDLDGLRGEGFRVMTKKRSTDGEQAISIDHSKKEVMVIEDHPDWDETLTIGRRKYRVRIAAWAPEGSAAPACRLVERGQALEFNRSYPPFTGGWDVETLKMVHAVIAEITAKSGPDVADVLTALQKRLLEAFGTKGGE